MIDFTLAPEAASDADAIEHLHEISFGPGRFARAAFRLREQGAHDIALSIAAHDADKTLIGSVRMTWIATPGQTQRGLLLGPLAVLPAFKNAGIGKALVRSALEKARLAQADYVLLVGDPPYYAPMGFAPVERGAIDLPGPFDPARLVIAALSDHAMSVRGMVRHGGG